LCSLFHNIWTVSASLFCSAVSFRLPIATPNVFQGVFSPPVEDSCAHLLFRRNTPSFEVGSLRFLASFNHRMFSCCLKLFQSSHTLAKRTPPAQNAHFSSPPSSVIAKLFFCPLLSPKGTFFLRNPLLVSRTYPGEITLLFLFSHLRHCSISARPMLLLVEVPIRYFPRLSIRLLPPAESVPCLGT